MTEKSQFTPDEAKLGSYLRRAMEAADEFGTGRFMIIGETSFDGHYKVTVTRATTGMASWHEDSGPTVSAEIHD